MKNMDRYLIVKDVSVKEAMQQMNKIGEKILFVVDEERKFYGSLTDGDIRRWILKEGNLKEKVGHICNKNPVFLGVDYDSEKVKKLMLSKRIEWIPVIDNDKVVDVLSWENVFGENITKEKLGIPVAIMAGGKGTRLEPFTRVLPKPLIPIGGKTIIEIIMDKFSLYGVRDFYVSVNHKSKMIKAYLEEIKTQYSINYLEEDIPLGTIGGLKSLQGKIHDSLLVSNCDIIVDCDYNDVVAFHNKNNYDITIVGSFRHFVIPYGICNIGNGGVLTDIIEKPEYDFLVNTGMVVLRQNTLELIPENQEFHITNLINSTKTNGGKIGVFPISEDAWIDVGQWEEYQKSIRRLGLE